MQRRSNEVGDCAQSFCDTLGGHPKSWVQFGSNKPQTLPKTKVQEVRRAKTNQRDSKSEFNYEPEGREFESPRARHLLFREIQGSCLYCPDHAETTLEVRIAED